MTDQHSEITIPRHLLEKYFGQDPRLLRAFETQSRVVAEHQDAIENNVATTGQLTDATAVTLSPNDALANEYVLQQGDGTTLRITTGSVKIDVDESVARASGYPVTFVAPVGVTLGLPSKGTLLSDAEPVALSGWTLDKPVLTGLVNAPDDATAAGAGVPVSGVYHNAGALRIRLV